VRPHNNQRADETMSSTLTMVNWCAGDGCDPCHCKWFTMPVSGAGLPWIFNGDGSLADSNFCGELLLAEGMNCLDTTGHSLGDIVDGVVDIAMAGFWAQFSPSTNPASVPSYAHPPNVLILVNGTVVASISPDLTNILDFSATPDATSGNIFGPGGAPIYWGIWTAFSRTTVPNCILRNLGMSGAINNPGNCVLPITGIAKPTSTAGVTLITPSWSFDPATPSVLFSNLYHLSGGMWVPTGGQHLYNANSSNVEVNQPWIYKHY
jgi:hypothetical protein